MRSSRPIAAPVGKRLARPSLVGLVCLLLLVAVPAHAYIDPGVLGMLYQGLYVLVLGGFATFVLKPWRFLKARFGRNTTKQVAEVADDVDAGDRDA